jgi:hypothetical protein
MANAHLANSHPDVTPDWIEWDFPRVSYLDAAKTTRIDTHRYEGIIPPVWCANGKVCKAQRGLDLYG